jgi:hypothetical protein
VPRDQRGESLLGIAFHVFPQQGDVIQFLHLRVNAANARKVTNYYAADETSPLPPAFSRKAHQTDKAAKPACALRDTSGKPNQ